MSSNVCPSISCVLSRWCTYARLCRVQARRGHPTRNGCRSVWCESDYRLILRVSCPDSALWAISEAAVSACKMSTGNVSANPPTERV